jgi:hypothetical protein
LSMQSSLDLKPAKTKRPAPRRDKLKFGQDRRLDELQLQSRQRRPLSRGGSRPTWRSCWGFGVCAGFFTCSHLR